MRNWSSQSVAALGLCAAFAVSAPQAIADPGALATDPVGNTASDEPVDPFDEEFDDAFELELARTSDMQRLDPFEGMNRKMFAFNEKVIDYFFDPIMVGYRFVFPSPVRKGLRQAYENLDAPRVLVNDILQLRFADAGETLARFVLNTAFGWGGLFDVAVEAGLEGHDSDFGQTLGKAGVPSGPYLMVPVFGPTTVRDGFGNVVDLAFQPLAYILGPAEIMLQVYIGSGSGLTAIDASRDQLRALEESSIDYYAALRSAYIQSRQGAVAEARASGITASTFASAESVAEEPTLAVVEPAAETSAARSRSDGPRAARASASPPAAPDPLSD